MVVEAAYDQGFIAQGTADQVNYEQHLHEAGKDETIPAGLSHLGDSGKKVDEDVTEWHFPTEEERSTLRRVPEKINFPTFAIGICEFAERFSYYGATQVYNNFIQFKRPVIDGVVQRSGAGHGIAQHSGALAMGSRAATGLITFNSFWCYVTPLVGAWLADTYWGRFKTITYGVFVAQIGHILLVISAIPGVLDNLQGAKACFIIALIIMGTGTGVFKASCPVLVAEQMKVKEETVVTLKSGERVIIDPALTTARVYVWYYLMINLGSLAGQLGMIYAEMNHGYWLAYLLPTLVFFLPVPVLWFGRNYYVSTPPQGSVLSTACKAWGRAIKASWSWNPTTFIRNCKSDHFWDVSRPSMVQDQSPDWMIYNDRWIDELSRGIKACAIFIFFPLYWLCYNQLTGPLLTQSSQMSLNGSPSELVSQLDPIFIIVMCPLFNLLVYPMIDRYRINFTPIKRITVGFICVSMSMIWASVLQHYIYQTNPCGKYVGDSITLNGVDCSEAASSINVWVQSGAYVLIGLSEIFASIVSMEIAMIMAPKNMRSIVMAIGSFTTAVAAAIGEAFVALSANPLFVVNYGVFAGLSFVGGILFWFFFYKIDRKQDELNLIGQEGYEKAQGFVTGGFVSTNEKNPESTTEAPSNEKAPPVLIP